MVAQAEHGPDWSDEDKTWPVGTIVSVMDVDNTPLGTGQLMTEFNPSDDNSEIPRIRLNNCRVLYGHECWWVPMEVLNGWPE